MKYKAVISDLDGTLLNSEHVISEYSKDVIRKIIKKGVKFIIATGRHHKDAICFKEQLGADSFLVSSNGAVVHDYKNDPIINHSMEIESVDYLLDFDMDKEIKKNIYTYEDWVVEEEVPLYKEFHKESGFAPLIMDLKKINKEVVSKFCYISSNISKINELKYSLEKDEEFLTKVSITSSLDMCLEIMNKDVSKGRAILEILAKEGIHPEEAIAFGDGLNDKEMLEVVGKGVIMGNASDGLKNSLPHHEIIGTSSEDSEAKYLEKIFL